MMLVRLVLCVRKPELLFLKLKNMNLSHFKELHKFSFSQACSDTNGKSTMIPPMAALSIIAGCICFLYSVFAKNENMAMLSTTMVGLGFAALGVRKFVNGKGDDLKIEPDKKEEDIV